MARQHGPLITRIVGWMHRTIAGNSGNAVAPGKRRPKFARTTDREVGLSRMASISGAAFSLLVSGALVALVLALLYGFITEYRRNVVVLDPISVPAMLVERGFTPTVVAQRLLDDAHAIQAEGGVWRGTPDITSRDEQIDITLLGSSLSMRSIVRYVRNLTGRPEPHISGEVTIDKGMATLWLRKGGERLSSVPVSASEGGTFDALFRSGAERLLQLTSPMDLFAYFYLTDQDNGEWQRASAVLDYIRDRTKGESLGEYWEDRGLLAELRLQSLEAIEAYDRAIALGRQPLPLIRKAAALADLDRDLEAVESLNAAARIPQLSANDWQVIGQVYHQLNRPEEMLEAGLRCAKLEATYPMCAIQTSEALRMLHRYEASLEALRPVANTNPLVWHYVQTSRVDALARVGDFREATRIVSDLTTKYPDDLSVRNSHAQMLLIMGRGAEAAPLFHTINAKYPTADGLCAEARARMSVGERDGIEVLIQSGRKRRANSPVCGLAAGEWETLRGRHDLAEVEFQAAVALDRYDPLLVRKWASALVALGQKDMAQQKEALATDLERRNREWKLSTH